MLLKKKKPHSSPICAPGSPSAAPQPAREGVLCFCLIPRARPRIRAPEGRTWPAQVSLTVRHPALRRFSDHRLVNEGSNKPWTPREWLFLNNCLCTYKTEIGLSGLQGQWWGMSSAECRQLPGGTQYTATVPSALPHSDFLTSTFQAK